MGALRVGHIEALRPKNAAQLHRFVHILLGVCVPREAVVLGNNAPFEYLVHSFFDGDQNTVGPGAGEKNPSGLYRGGDLLVWANRGGGKTYLGAVATLLDLVFKPGIQVRILGGSLEQSSKMYRYLQQMLDLRIFRSLIAREPTQRRVELVNGSVVELLSQSQRSVRGHRVHKLRCDEVEEFKPEVWEAAQLVTQSGWCGDQWVNGTVEALSTMHRPFGLMNRLVDHTVSKGVGNEKNGRLLLRWCALDVIERCPEERPCETCVLWEDCQGRAKNANGFLAVDDLVLQWHRSSNEVWASEILCRRPRRSDSVYPGFDPAVGGQHVLGREGKHPDPQGESGAGDAGLERAGGYLAGGMDFGLRSPTVMLWVNVWPGDEDQNEQVIEVVDEYVQRDLTLEAHLAAIEDRGWDKPQWLGVDPAGGQRNLHTGLTDIQVLRRHGYKVRWRTSGLQDGIERIRRRLDRETLKINPRCKQLIAALTQYHFDPQHHDREAPVKDGPDHLCDALRYMVINLECGGVKVTTRNYW